MVGDDHTWGFFPSISFLGYETGKEWLRHIKDITMLKPARPAVGRVILYGISGLYHDEHGETERHCFGEQFGSTVTMGMISNNNPDLKNGKHVLPEPGC